MIEISHAIKRYEKIRRSSCGNYYFFLLILIILVTTTGCGILNHQMTGNDVIKAFKQAGLQAENVHPMTTGEYGEAPRVCNGTQFLIPSLGPDNGGRVFICDKQDEQNQIVSYYEGLNQDKLPLFFMGIYKRKYCCPDQRRPRRRYCRKI